MKDVFTKIYKANSWKSEESASGLGSEMESTTDIRERLPIYFEAYNIRRVLDIGCGDFNWMKTIVGKLDYYLGIDVVSEMIDKNNSLYGCETIRFKCKCMSDIIDELYEDFDAVIIRDVFVHLSNDDISLMLDKLKLGRIPYLFSTTFLGWGKNVDIHRGGWRPINLLLEPFNLPRPIESIISYKEPYSLIDGDVLSDKALLMWRMPRIITDKHNSFSNYHVHRQIRTIKPKSLTDVGTGDGYWGTVIRLLCPECTIIGIELSSKWFDHSESLGVYNVMINDNMANAISDVSGDVVIFGDVLEHAEKDVAMEVLRLAVSRFKYVIVNAPVGFVPQEHEDTEEIHRCGLTLDDMQRFNVLEYQESDGLTEYKVFNCLIRGEQGVSLILSSFRRAHLLDRSLFSIARQNISGLEVVVINDGIEDDTESIVNQYRDRLDIKYIFSGQRNADGDKWRVSGFALNIGVKVCKYDRIILSCAEIYHLNNAISYLADALIGYPMVLASTKIIYFDADGSFFSNIKTTESKQSLKADNEAYDCRLMPFFMGMWKDRFIEIGGYDEDFTGYACDDNDLISRLISNGCYYTFTDAEVVHLFHGKRCDSQIHWEDPAWAYNRKLFISRKNKIIRNENREWGKI